MAVVVADHETTRAEFEGALVDVARVWRLGDSGTGTDLSSFASPALIFETLV